MIKKTCLENEYIRKKSQEISADPILVERAIYAFELLSLLIKGKIPLIFKGGTSLMLLIPELKRLSIDIDIITEAEDATLKNAFSSLTIDSLFKRWEEDKRNANREFFKRHFKFYYDSPKELKDGIKRIKSHILGGKYSTLQAKGDASKIAYLTSLMREERLDIDIDGIRKNRNDLDKIIKISLTDNYSILNKLKKLSPDSFYLWALALNVI